MDLKTALVLIAIILIVSAPFIAYTAGKSKGAKDAWNEAINDTSTRILGIASWFSGEERVRVYNALFLLGHSLKRYGHCSADRLRDKTDKIKDRPIHKMTQEEQNDLINS